MTVSGCLIPGISPPIATGKIFLRISAQAQQLNTNTVCRVCSNRNAQMRAANGMELSRSAGSAQVPPLTNCFLKRNRRCYPAPSGAGASSDGLCGSQFHRTLMLIETSSMKPLVPVIVGWSPMGSSARERCRLQRLARVGIEPAVGIKQTLGHFLAKYAADPAHKYEFSTAYHLSRINALDFKVNNV
jgi:hypothetical protein